MRIAFAMIAHQNPQAIERLVRILVGAGHCVAVHYDARAPEAGYQALAAAFAGNDSFRLARKFHVRWGQWSIVSATLACLDEIAAAGWEPDYVHLMSGSDYPLRPIADFAAFLERNAGREFIECVPANERRWVRGGLQQERYLYRFYFNWRDQRLWFDLSYWIQKFLGLKRRFVRGFEPHMGSQWWTLSWGTVKQILALARQRDIERFFRTTLIPDELFFQTLVARLVHFRNISNHTLTLYQFTDYGVPVVYYADHLGYLLRQPFFFARKVSPYNAALQDGLEAAWREEAESRPREFPDEAFGRVGTEYEDYRIAHRMGPPGRPLPGLPPNRWFDDLGSMVKPSFCILGTSTVELRLLQRALAHAPDLLCHGQLFHPTCIEFADGVPSYAGYDRDDLELRHVSAPTFLSDIIRTEPERNSGFLLRAGQGWHLYEVAFELASIRIAVVRGDPLVAFIESLKPVPPRIDEPFDMSILFDRPPEALVNRFTRFVLEFCGYNRRIDELMLLSAEKKPEGWLTYVDLGMHRPESGVAHRPKITYEDTDIEGEVELVKVVPQLAKPDPVAALLRWRGWMGQLATCLDITFDGDPDWGEFAREVARLEEYRRIAIERLVECGLNRAALENLRQGAADPRIALAFVLGVNTPKIEDEVERKKERAARRAARKQKEEAERKRALT